jgi:hypothetical protein
MKPLVKYLILLTGMNILILIAGTILVETSLITLAVSDILILSGLFSIITAISLIIFFRGMNRPPDTGTMHTLLAVSLKFLMELILALVWFIVAKKSSFHSVLIFFVLYLTFTLILVGILLKSLRNKSL